MRRRLPVLAAALVSLVPAAGSPDANPIVTTLALFAGTSSGLRLSQDWGVTWPARDAAVADGLQGVGAVRAIVPLGPTIYLGGDGGLYVSQDFGRTWEKLGVLGSVQCILLGRYFDVEPIVLVGTREGMLKSDDGGRSFHATGLRGTPVTRLEWPGPALVAATGRGVLVSVDSGTTFAGAGEGLPEGEVRAMVLSSFYPIDPVLFAAVGNGVFRSGDGGRTWKEAGLADQAVTDLAWMGPFLYACTSGGLYITQDMGVTWRRLTDGLADVTPARIFFPSAPDSSAEAFLATDHGIFRTPDGGRHWLPTGFKDEAALLVSAFPPPPKLGRGKKKS
jgi:photosystem II stability/assembly factor-like uncharacterized protein